MENSVLASVMNTVAGNVSAHARRNSIGAEKANAVNTMMGAVMQQLNDNGTLEKIPEQVREYYITDTTQAVAITALTSDRELDQASLMQAMQTEIAGSKAAKLAQQRAVQESSGAVMRGASGRRIVRTPGVSSVEENSGGTD